MKTISLLIILIGTQFIWAQKKVIDHTAYNDWKTLSNNQISKSGKFITYEVNPLRGNGYLYLFNTATNQLDSFHRAKNASISFDEKYMAFIITPGFDTLRNCELNKIDKKKWPKDTLAIYIFETKELMKFSDVKSHRVEKDNNWLTYLHNENKLPSDFIVKKKKKPKKKSNKNKEKTEPKSSGTVLRIFDPISKVEFNYKNVTDYSVSKDGNQLAYVTNLNDSSSLNLLNLTTSENSKISSLVDFKQIAFNELATRLAYLVSGDTTKTKKYDLFCYDIKGKTNKPLIDTTSQGIPKGKSVSEHRKLSFSKNDAMLYFGVADTPIEEPKDSLLDSEKPKLDIWHYSESRLQSVQLKRMKDDLKKTDLYVYHFDEGKSVALTSDTLSGNPEIEHNGEFILASSNEKYALDYQWDASGKEDLYTVNLKTGETKLILREVRYYANLSSRSDQLVTFEFATKQYNALNLKTGENLCLTCSDEGIDWVQDLNGMPQDPEPRGVFGWSKDGSVCYLKSRFDVYSYDFNSKRLSCVTNNEGQSKGIEFEPEKWNYDSTFVDLSNVYFQGFNTKTKGTHIYEFSNDKFVETLYLDERISDLKKSKVNDIRTMRSMTISKYPDLVLATNRFENRKKISNANPTQSDYNWATVELVNWKSYKGIELEGLLYKPENFDPSKSYPMIVYYYELLSDGLHNYYSPKPTASVVHPTEYASAGYFIFIPDIRYEAGHPANSAYDCIMSGTDAMLKKYTSIDSTRLGLQGQSWGGYQTAQLITMTTRYKAAMAGAPVTNMFSAYGGIRWGSGLNRQFQYEKSQSRIGKTIWEAPQLYIENSPQFHLPKVNTPLLIMHNDADGAVPWYQGIELFTGLRRLKKPCWLLNYNEDDHNLMKNANRIDLSIRMRQFFDYYLNNQQAPLWLIEGIPAVKKGEELRYELIKN